VPSFKGSFRGNYTVKGQLTLRSWIEVLFKTLDCKDENSKDFFIDFAYCLYLLLSTLWVVLTLSFSTSDLNSLILERSLVLMLNFALVVRLLEAVVLHVSKDFGLPESQYASKFRITSYRFVSLVVDELSS